VNPSAFGAFNVEQEKRSLDDRARQPGQSMSGSLNKGFRSRSGAGAGEKP